VIVRCTARLRALLGAQAQQPAELEPAASDFYAHLITIDRRKCLLVTHAGTLFSIFAADVRAAQLRPLGPYVVSRIAARLAAEGLEEWALGELDADRVRIAKTVDRSVLGCMNDLALTCQLATEHAGGLQALDLKGLNRMLARHISAARGYVPAIDLVKAAPTARP
jgi:hypothetical protein